MPLSSLCAVLLAALCHAIWNLEAKRAASSRHFVWLYSAASLLLWAPAVVWALCQQHAPYGIAQYLALAGTAVLHLLYSQSLQAGYRVADLSLVYPVARGSGPLLSFVGASLLFGERPGPLALAGLLLILAGIVLIADLHHALRRSALPGLRWGALTGACIAAYTLNDGWAVKVLGVSPFLIDFSGNVFRVLALSRPALRTRPDLVREWRAYRRPVMTVALLGPLGYLLVLFAMQRAPISHVAPARELATLVGTWFGARLLGEQAAAQRLAGALCIVAGVVSLALSG
ncbi:MAG TPA: DMT family transporter [Steroidobacteraceae bacterium]|nr:DMT family transporter [Steroidobacteraceae bacterium]